MFETSQSAANPLLSFQSNDPEATAFYAAVEELEQQLRQLAFEFGLTDDCLCNFGDSSGTLKLTEVVLAEA